MATKELKQFKLLNSYRRNIHELTLDEVKEWHSPLIGRYFALGKLTREGNPTLFDDEVGRHVLLEQIDGRDDDQWTIRSWL